MNSSHPLATNLTGLALPRLCRRRSTRSYAAKPASRRTQPAFTLTCFSSADLAFTAFSLAVWSLITCSFIACSVDPTEKGLGGACAQPDDCRPGLVCENNVCAESSSRDVSPEVDTAPDTDGDTAADMTNDTSPPSGSLCTSLAQGAESGTFELSTEERGEVYCDNETLGGGWLLVARSSGTDSSLSFGLADNTGTLDEIEMPYTLSLVGNNAAEVGFSEVLVAERAGLEFEVDGSDYFVFDLLDTDIDDCLESGCQVEPRGTGSDTCVLPQLFFGPLEQPDRIVLSADQASISTGLGPAGFLGSLQACSGNDFTGHGMVFVR